MTVKSKKILASMAACAICALTALSASAATNPPAGSQQWGNDDGVVFDLTQVGTMTKNNTNNTSYMSYEGGPNNVNIWLRSYTFRGGKDALASSREFFRLSEERYVNTGAVQGDYVRLYANRENFWDNNDPAAVNGKWLA